MKQFRIRTMLMLAVVATLTTACTKKTVATAHPPAAPAATETRSTPAPEAAPTRSTPAETPKTASNTSKFPDAATRAHINELLARIEDAYFDYNQATLRPDAVKTLQADSTELRNILKDYPDYKLTIEGHADERGSAEFNMALGDRRAQSAKDYLVQVGIPSSQLNVVSYGKERPICTDHEENCWQKNRRIHIIPASKTPAD